MRVALVGTERCSRNCTGCYYGWRDRPKTPDNTTGILQEIAANPMCDGIAVGINPRHTETDIKLIRIALENNVSVLVTAKSMYDVPLDIIENIDCLSLSVTCPADIPTHTDAMYMNKIGTQTIVSIQHSDVYDLRRYDEAFTFGGMHCSIYLLMKKGTPDSGWRISEYLDEYVIAASEIREYSDKTVIVDECVALVGASASGKGKCNGYWTELTAYGTARICPYTASYIEYSTIDQARRIIASCNHAQPLCTKRRVSSTTKP